MNENSYDPFDLIAIINFIIGISNYSQNQKQNEKQHIVDDKLDAILAEIEELRRDITNVSE